MKITLENALEFSTYMLKEYYGQNIEPFFSVLHRDTTWIGPGNLFVFGAAAIQSYFVDGFVMPVMLLEDEEFFYLCRRKNSVIVMGRYFLYSNPKAKAICMMHQRTTFYYEQRDEQLFLMHLHVSNEWNELVGKEVFPIQISTKTYEYVQKLLEDRGREKNSLKIVLKSGRYLQLIHPERVVFIEACGESCIFYSIKKIITIKKSLKEITAVFPDYFYRIHRSYLINVDCISSVKRYAVSMITGEELPIPEKRYTTIKKEIFDLLKNRGHLEGVQKVGKAK